MPQKNRDGKCEREIEKHEHLNGKNQCTTKRSFNKERKGMGNFQKHKDLDGQ